MSKKIFWIVIVLVVCVLAVILITNQEKNTPVTINYENQPYIGDESAQVSIVEFGDYKCIHCSDFNSSTAPYIIENFVNNGQAKFYFINYAFLSDESTEAALFAETVYQQLGNDMFWQFHDLLFEYGVDNELNQEVLESILQEVATGSQVEQVRQANKDKSIQEALDRDMGIAKDLRVNSTPTIFINGVEFSGKTMDDFAKRVTEAGNGQ